MEKRLEIFTDGGCHGNPGPGGWAFRAVSSDGTVVREASGADSQTTNNRMELLAVIRALMFIGSLSERVDVAIVTDSTYVRNGITQWIHSWKKNGWKTAAGKPVKNRDLWLELDTLNDTVHPEWHWVKGHAGDIHNEACDALVQHVINGL